MCPRARPRRPGTTTREHRDGRWKVSATEQQSRTSQADDGAISSRDRSIRPSSCIPVGSSQIRMYRVKHRKRSWPCAFRARTFFHGRHGPRRRPVRCSTPSLQRCGCGLGRSRCSRKGCPHRGQSRWRTHTSQGRRSCAHVARDALLPLRRFAAERWPDLIKSHGGGANAILVRGAAIAEHRSLVLTRRPERRVAHGVLLAPDTWVVNLHATAHDPRRARADVDRARRGLGGHGAAGVRGRPQPAQP